MRPEEQAVAREAWRERNYFWQKAQHAWKPGIVDQARDHEHCLDTGGVEDFKEGMVLGDVCSEVVWKTKYPEPHPTVGCGMETARERERDGCFR